MKKKKLIVAVVALAIIGVIVGLVLNRTKPTSTSNTFNPQQLDNLSYVVTSKTTIGGDIFTSIIESDGKGNQKSTTSMDDFQDVTYDTPDGTITCRQGSSCTKLDKKTISDEMTAKLSELNQSYKDSAKYSGTGDCASETCDLWKVKGPVGEMTYYIDADNRVRKLVLADNSTLIYEYKPVTITVPSV